MKIIVLLVALWLGAGTAAAQPTVLPTQGDLDAIRDRLQKARQAARSLTAEHRDTVLEKIKTAEGALKNYERLQLHAERRKKTRDLLWMAGGVTLADDASGAGVADDVLLPIIALAAVAHHLLTQPAVKDVELGAAWNELMQSLAAAGEAARVVAGSLSFAATRPGRKNCEENLKRCLETRLGARNSGGKSGRSICADCFQACKGELKAWPDSTNYGADCQWWNYIRR
jgi:hypothetical protein